MHCATRMPTSAESEITIPSSDCRNSRCMSVVCLAQCTEAVVLLTAGGQREQCGNPGAAGSSDWWRVRACHCSVFRARQGLTLLLLLVKNRRD